MNKYFSGAGIIPIIIYNDAPYFILFSCGKGLISDAGGTIELNDSIEQTAIRELYEESCGIININDKDLEKKSVYLDIINQDKNNEFYKKLYRAYFILIDNINLSDLLHYYVNLKKFKPFDRNPFTETYGIHLIKLDWIHYYNDNIYMNTHTDKLKLLNMRLSIIMSTIIDIYGDLDSFYNIINNKIKKIKLNKKLINIDTYSYKNNNKINVDNIITFIS
jgi:hypothetical protein